MSDIYQEIILDHYRNPRNHGTIEHPTHQATALNASCGDTLQMDIVVKNDIIEEVKFSGNGCAISQASASLLTEEIRRKLVSQASVLEPKDVLKLLGVILSPSRIKCGLLSLETLKKTLASKKSLSIFSPPSSALKKSVPSTTKSPKRMLGGKRSSVNHR